ncbi:MAG: hypothetical protein AAGG08_08580 [Actinomycetota bacterium]
MADADDVQPAIARRLGAALEPVIGQVYFSPEAHAGYVALGFDPSPGDAGGVALPDGPAYFTSRGSLLGHVPGEVVAAAFGVFSPAVVVPAVTLGWTRTDAPTIRRARHDGAVGQLRRLLGDEPDGIDVVVELLHRAIEPLRVEGRPIFAGIRSEPLDDDPIGALFQLGDALREFRGDAHIAAWTNAGYDAVEISLATELFWGLPMRSYARTRAWTGDEFDAATERLRRRGHVDDGGFTDIGRAAREQVEADTDVAMAPTLAALGDDIDVLIAALRPWGVAIRAGFGYLRSGPHDLAPN